MSLFSKKTGNQANNQVSRIQSSVDAALKNGQFSQPSVTKAALSMESINDAAASQLKDTVSGLQASLESIIGELHMDDKVAPYQVEAGVAAGVLAGDVRAFMGHKVQSNIPAQEGMFVVNPINISDMSSTRPSMEAYDERENRNAQSFSITYNMQAARQDDFGETLFPTIVVTPDQVGFGITVRLMQVYNEFTRNVSGALDNYGKKNVIRAWADHTILKNESTRVVPVVRPAAVANFVPAAIIPPRTISLEGEPILTAPLAFGKKFSLIALSQTEALLKNGAMDMTDSLDAAIELSMVYYKVGNDVISVNTANLPLSRFTYTTQNNYRVMTLNFETTSALITKNTKNIDSSALTTLSPIVTNDLIVRLAINASGSVNIELGDTALYGNLLEVHSVQNAAGEFLDLSTGPGKDVVDLYAGGSLVGYDLKCYRSNANRRQRGQLVDTTYTTQMYTVPLRAPVTALHPVTTDGQTDTTDLTGLVTITRARTTNAAVTALLENVDLLAEYVDARDVNGVPPDVLGVGRFYVKPVFFHEHLVMTDLVDSLSSHQRAEDTQAAMVNKVRDYAYRMYSDSEYKAAADALSGGVAPIPTVVIATDQVIARYLTVTGDLRTLGNEFNVRIVSSLDDRVRGKVFITFGVFDENRNTTPNPLNFGNMAWSPELTIVLPISRNGQISRELAVSPRFLHFVNCPIMTVLTVEGIPDVMNKVPLFVKPIV